MAVFLGSLKVISDFFKEEEEKKKEFSEHDEEISYIKAKGHRFIHTEDDSVTQQMRGY